MSVPSTCPGEKSGRFASSTLPPDGGGRDASVGSTKEANAMSASVPAGTIKRIHSGRLANADTRSAGSSESTSSPRIANSRIDQHMKDVREKRCRHGSCGNDQHNRLHDGDVTCMGRLNQKVADTRQRKDLLDDDRSAEQRAEIEADEGYHADQRVRQGMAKQYPPRPEPFRFRGQDVTGPLDLVDEAAAEEPRVDTEKWRAEGDCGKHQ